MNNKTKRWITSLAIGALIGAILLGLCIFLMAVVFDDKVVPDPVEMFVKVAMWPSYPVVYLLNEWKQHFHLEDGTVNLLAIPLMLGISSLVYGAIAHALFTRSAISRAAINGELLL